MANWVTLANGVHIDLDDPNNPLTGDGSFESYLGGGDKGSSNETRSIAKYLDKNGHVTDATRVAYEKHIDKYYNEAGQIIKSAGLKDENLSYAHGLKIDYAKGDINEKELIAGFKENQTKNSSGSKGSYKDNLKTELTTRIKQNLEYGYPTRAGMKKALSSFLEDYPDATNKDIAEAMNSMSPRFTGRKWSEDDIVSLMTDRPFRRF